MFQRLDAALAENQPKLYATLQPGRVIPWKEPGQIKHWYRWRDGQSRDSQVTLLGSYHFASYSEARTELQILRRSFIEAPLNALILVALAPQTFSSLPLLTDVAGDGYYFHLRRRTVYYRFKGEQDIDFPRFESFLEFLIELVSQPPRSVGRSAEKEFELLGRFANLNG
ncbi:MAG: hypothetical protein KDA80_16725 [Planctomycetaceae bacterium]|nr:hypothetical protein [Planctomycetaceae bacterium]